MTTQLPDDDSGTDQTLDFLKVHGAGNDFVLIPDLQDRLQLTASLTRALCDRNRGIGADGAIRLGPARDGVQADVFMDYRNADGGIAEMCGNGVRTVAKYIADRGDLDVVAVDTRAGIKRVQINRGADGLTASCRVDMGAPVPGDVGRKVELGDGTIVEVTIVSMGNPHAVVLVDDVEEAPVRTIGPAVEHHPDFPEGTNVEFIHAPSRDRVDGRIWERGVGETLASGTGGSAMAVAAALNDLTGRVVDVHLRGGVLRVEWGEETLHVTGPAVEVASGQLDPSWFAAVGGRTT